MIFSIILFNNNNNNNNRFYLHGAFHVTQKQYKITFNKKKSTHQQSSFILVKIQQSTLIQIMYLKGLLAKQFFYINEISEVVKQTQKNNLFPITE